MNFAHNMNLRSVSDINIHRGPELRAILKFSAEPRVSPMGGNFAWCWCMVSWVMIFQFEYVNLRWWAYNWFDMACRDGPTLKFIRFKQYLSTAGGNLHQSCLAIISTYWLVCWCVLERLSFIFDFLLSQPELWWCGFRFCKVEFWEHFWCKVMGRSNCCPWW